MRKQTGNIATLSFAVRQQLNEKLRDNKALCAVAEWLFSVVDEETNLPVGERWLAELPTGCKGNRARALKNCVMALSRYRDSAGYSEWLTGDKRSDVVGGMVANLTALTKASGGGNALQEASGMSRLLLSIAGEKLELIAAGKATPADLEILFKSGSKLVQNVTKIESARLDRDKFETTIAERLLDESNRTRAAQIADSNAPRAEKIAQLRQVYFADIDAEKVVLPK